MAVRRGPGIGYDVGLKRQYRRNLYATATGLRTVPLCDMRVFMLPSIEGGEIETAQQYGIKECNITVCDVNPAIVASLKRRFPLVRTCGVSAYRALVDRLPASERFHFINLDLCGTVFTAAPTAAVAAARLYPGGALAVTWQKGRDRGVCHVLQFLKMVQRRHYLNGILPEAHRILTIGRRNANSNFVSDDGPDSHALVVARANRYRLHRSMMQWALWRSVPIGSVSAYGEVIERLTPEARAIARSVLAGVLDADYPRWLIREARAALTYSPEQYRRDRARYVGPDGNCICPVCQKRKKYSEEVRYGT